MDEPRLDVRRYRAAFEGSADALFLSSAEGQYLDVNDAACALTGYRREEFLGLTVVDLVDPEELATRPLAMAPMRDGQSVRIRRRMRRKDGTTFPSEIMGRMLADGTLLGSVRDMTDEDRLQTDLRASEARYRSLVAACPDAILELDRDARINFASPAAVDLFGATDVEDLVGRSAIALLAPGQEAAAVARLGRRMAGEDLAPTEWDVITLDGRRLICELNLGILRAPDGSPNGIMTLARDVTERRRAADQLRHVSRLYALLSHISMAVVRATNEAAFLQQVCEVAVEHGQARVAWIARLSDDRRSIVPSATAGVAADTLAAWSCAVGVDHTPRGPLWTALLSGEIELCNDITTDVRAASWRKIAEGFQLRAGASAPLICGGEVIGALNIYSSEADFFSPAEAGVLRQITDEINFALNKLAGDRERQRAQAERAVLQDRLIQAQKMESVGRLAGGIAHDFNNMLSVILGNLDLATATLHPGSELHATLSSAKDAARRSADITRQLLTFARRQTTAPRVLDLNAAVEGALKMLQRLIGEDIELVWSPGLPLSRVRIDPAQVDQVLANLAANARDAIVGVGRVEVRTADVAVEAGTAGVPAGEYVLLEVADSGIGMDAETLAHAFEPFFTTKSGDRGTGLGLATVYGIVDQNGGTITVTSAPGAGTTFRIFLPRVDGAPLPPPPVTSPPLARGQGKVLVVEDEPALARVVRLALTRLGYTVLVAHSPAEALTLFQTEGPTVDLLLTDIVMPGMNGRDLAAALMQRSPRLKCLFMSGYLGDVIGRGGVLDEGVQLLQKPFTMEALATRVAEMMQG